MAVQSGGHPDSVAREYGVSRASVYNWMKDYRVQGVSGLIHENGDRRFALKRTTPFETMRRVRAVLVRHPEWSADKLSSFLGAMGMPISPRTLRNIFKRLGVSTAEQRRANAFKPDYEDISDNELEVIIRELEDHQKGEPSGCRPGDVMLQDRVKFPKGFCVEPLAIEIVVDTFAPFRRIYAMLAAPSHQLSVDAFVEVERVYKRQCLKIHTVRVPRKEQYAENLGAVAYPKLFKEPWRPIVDVRPVNSKTADRRIKAVWALLQAEWLKTMPTRLAPENRTPKQIDDDLEEWLVARRGLH